MTIRTDITIDWFSDPRVITVAAPSTEVTIQDLHDTCKHFENLSEGMFHPYLINSAGKEPLGGSVYVGITATLNNAVLSFEERGGPDWILCSISGGNLVAFDELGVEIDPRLPTAYVSCDRTAASSATLMEQEALQYSSFEGAVTYDEDSGYSGTDFPTGTLQQPVDNFTDALSILSERGLSTIRVLGDATLGNDDYTGVIFIGESLSKTELTIPTGADVTNCEFYDCTLLGTLDGNAVVKDSRIEDLTYITGVIERCLLDDGVITLGGSQEAIFLDCWCGSPNALPVIDMGGSGQDLSIRNYSGGVEIKNLTGSNTISATLLAGKVILQDTITAGTVVMGGNGELEDSSGNLITTGTWNGGVTVDTSCLLNPTVITTQVWDEPTADRQIPGTIGGDYYNMLMGFDWMSKIITNKKTLEKSGNTWSLTIYADDDTTPILTKELKDKDGNDIDDITAGVLAQELKSSV